MSRAASTKQRQQVIDKRTGKPRRSSQTPAKATAAPADPTWNVVVDLSSEHWPPADQPGRSTIVRWTVKAPTWWKARWAALQNSPKWLDRYPFIFIIAVGSDFGGETRVPSSRPTAESSRLMVSLKTRKERGPK